MYYVVSNSIAKAGVHFGGNKTAMGAVRTLGYIRWTLYISCFGKLGSECEARSKTPETVLIIDREIGANVFPSVFWRVDSITSEASLKLFGKTKPQVCLANMDR